MVSISQKWRLPAACFACAQYHKTPLPLCEPCYLSLSKISSACHYCALPLPPSDFPVCGHCCKQKPIMDHTYAPFVFEEPLRSLLHQFKYREGLYLSAFLSDLILQAMPEENLYTECLIPIPLHPKRLQQRGFNQAAELAKYLGKKLNIPIELKACRKTIHTTPQAGLNQHQRQKNLKNAFDADLLPYQHVTLIDDLFTTGSTANALAEVLKKNGVMQVNVWCPARALNHY